MNSSTNQSEVFVSENVCVNEEGKISKFQYKTFQYSLSGESETNQNEAVSSSIVKSHSLTEGLEPLNTEDSRSNKYGACLKTKETPVDTGLSEEKRSPYCSINSGQRFKARDYKSTIVSKPYLLEKSEEQINIPQGVCRYYWRNGFCRYGKFCRYRHIPNRFKGPTTQKNKRFLSENVTHPCKNSSGLVEEKTSLEKKHKQFEEANRGDKNDPHLQFHTNTVVENKQNIPRKRNCNFFKWYGYCHYEDKCYFRHSNSKVLQAKDSVHDSEKASVKHDEICNGSKLMVTNSLWLQAKTSDASSKLPGVTESLGNISIQKECSEHIELEKPDGKSTTSVKKEMSGRCQGSVPLLRKKLLLDSLSPNDLMELREMEIMQLRKRFPNYCQLSDVNSGSESTFLVRFTPTDPDWPFDLKYIDLKVVFEKDYPCKSCMVTVVDENDTLPELLLRFLNKSIQKWLVQRNDDIQKVGEVELTFRPFLRWLDKNLEDMFIEGLRMVKREREARAAGIECIPFEELFHGKQNIDGDHADEDTTTELNQTDGSKESEKSVENIESQVLESDRRENTDTNNEVLSTPKRGTEVKLQSLQLGENVATLVCQKINITVQCSRCKTQHEISTPARRNNVIQCTKCHHMQEIAFRASLLHRFSPVLGYLDLVGCKAVDLPLMMCELTVCCLNCSKQMTMTGIHYGQSRNTWCHFCNVKLTIFADTVKFSQLQLTENLDKGQTQLIRLQRKDKLIKDPAIQDGKPLPENGTCKHYKKSFRWLRFPCCGKAYPCDLCHDEKEMDHDMELATRMICGFCAKEQAYTSDKPCKRCFLYMTKKRSAYWEGGKGCRDKIHMSRDDKKKYSGKNKTVSRKQLDKTKPSGKQK